MHNTVNDAHDVTLLLCCYMLHCCEHVVVPQVRISRGRHASGCIVPWPQREPPKLDYQVGEKDTRPEDAEAQTYNPKDDFGLQVPAAHR